MFCIRFVNNGFDACRKEVMDFLTSIIKRQMYLLIRAIESTSMNFHVKIHKVLMHLYCQQLNNQDVKDQILRNLKLVQIEF